MRLAILVVLVGFGFVASATANGVDEIRACVRKNLPSKSSVQELELHSVDRTGVENILSASLYWKRTADGLAKILARVASPPDLRGSAVLLLEGKDRSDIFMYLPELQRVRRIRARTVSGSLFGTDFSYEDLDRLEAIGAGANATRLADAQVADQSTYVLAGSPSPDSGSAYERVVSFIDQKTCIPLKVELYEKGGQLRKLLTADPALVRREGGIWFPDQMTLKDLAEQSETRLLVKKIAVDIEISDNVFTEGALNSSGH